MFPHPVLRSPLSCCNQDCLQLHTSSQWVYLHATALSRLRLMKTLSSTNLSHFVISEKPANQMRATKSTGNVEDYNGCWYIKSESKMLRTWRTTTICIGRTFKFWDVRLIEVRVFLKVVISVNRWDAGQYLLGWGWTRYPRFQVFLCFFHFSSENSIFSF